METLAFELNDIGKTDEAKKLLNGDLYKTQKKIYAQGMGEFTAKLNSHIDQRISQVVTYASYTEFVVVIAFIALIVLWLFAVKQIQKWILLIKEAKDDATLASRMKSEFLANMSHELRTPLNSMLILSQEMTENDSGNLTEEQVEDSHIIHNSGQDLLVIINDILDLSKIEAGKMEINVDNVHLAEIVTNIHRKFDRVAEKNKLFLRVEMSDDLPETFISDQLRLEQVLRNFLSNALKFTHEGGVSVSIFRLGEEIVFSVADTGIGFPEDGYDALFAPFQQVDGTISRKYGGTGLGLSISKKFARLLGGRLTAHGKEAEGSTFTLYLPQNYTGEAEYESESFKSVSSDVAKNQVH